MRRSVQSPGRRLAVAFAIFAVIASPVRSRFSSCSSSQARTAEGAAARLGDWTKVHVFYLRFGRCDDGAIADDVSEGIVRLLADQWQDLHLLVEFTEKDPRFQKFVLSHIDSTADTDDLKKIHTASLKACPPNSTAFCKRLAVAAEAALQ